MSSSESGALEKRPGGRRVLFVDPPSVIEEQMIHFLVAAQFEAAVIPDPRRIQPVLWKFPRSVVYFNIDTRLPPSALEQIVQGVMNTAPQHGGDVGILSYNENPELAQKYLMDFGVTAGYITLQIGFAKSARIIVKALEAAEARGDRKFVRVRAPVGKASLNINVGNKVVEGQILDISEAGAACLLNGDYGIGTYLADIQMRLWGNLARTAGTIRGQRVTPQGTVSVIMFDPFVDSASRGKLYKFLRRVMQHEVESVM